jgi:hypothetical protein
LGLNEKTALGGIMNRYESIVACGVIAFFAAALVIRFVFEIIKLLLSSAAEFFSLTPPWFWGLAIGVAIVIGLCALALYVLHLNTRMRNQSNVVSVEGRHAVVFHDGAPTAISFDGREITSKRIGRHPLSQPEEQILIKMAERRGRVTYAAPRLLKNKGGV